MCLCLGKCQRDTFVESTVLMNVEVNSVAVNLPGFWVKDLAEVKGQVSLRETNGRPRFVLI